MMSLTQPCTRTQDDECEVLTLALDQQAVHRVQLLQQGMP